MPNTDTSELLPTIRSAMDLRNTLLKAPETEVYRLFNGFYEGCPGLVIERFAKTAVVTIYAKDSDYRNQLRNFIVHQLAGELAGIGTVILKDRYADRRSLRKGIVVHGSKIDDKAREFGTWYALDLMLHQDSGFYPDARNVRLWAAQNLGGKTVLNTFAYTGSLGVAAAVAGASDVFHVERNARFLEVAKRSYQLNSLKIKRSRFIADDFFSQIKRLKNLGTTFGCIFLDPPLFSQTEKGTIDLMGNFSRAINKVRPLVEDGGHIIVMNNALFLSGADYIRGLTELCADEYLTVESLIPVPEDCTGYPSSVVGKPPADPAPFNHPTKIAVLKVRKR